MLNETDFLLWCKRLALTEKAQVAVTEARSRNPTRRVGGGRKNVSGRYPSRKMGVIIQFESHRVELPSRRFMTGCASKLCSIGWSRSSSRYRPPEGVSYYEQIQRFGLVRL